MGKKGGYKPGAKKRAAAAARKKREEEERLAAEADKLGISPEGGGEDTSSSGSSSSSTGRATPSGTGGATGRGGGGEGGGASGGGGGEGGGEEREEFDAMAGEELHRQLMDEAMDRITVTYTSNEKLVHPNSRDIQVEGLNVTLGSKDLVKDAHLSLNWGSRYGLIGRNGCGKSILLTLLGRRKVPIPSSIDIYHVVSEIDATEMTALEAVLAVDTERAKLEDEVDKLGNMIAEGDDSEETAERMAEIYERLDELGADTAEAKAAMLLHGLGFTKEMQNKATKDFSGGWRMRIALARALFLQPDCLLLDQPTNHLDMEAVVWLEGYLSKWTKILFLVSHSQDFLNNVCTHIVHFRDGALTNYTGNYDQYVMTRAELEEHQMKRYQWEQEQIKHMKEYIARFGHGTSKMARQAQSKEKTLAKMERKGLTAKVEKEKSLNMHFPDPGTIPPPVLQMNNVSFAYPSCPELYKKVDFGVDLDSRIALVGPNGAGKSTLVKLMCGELTPTGGVVRPHPHLRIAKYTQHFVDALDLNQTPLEFFGKLRKEDSEPTLRSYLGRFGVGGDDQTTTMKYLSDGIKSRVVFAMMATRTPHILMLDEPTNNLDIETIDSLADCINNFKGGLVLVSHDMRLISQVAKEIWECDKGTITRWPGSILEYKQMLQKHLAAVDGGVVRGDAVAELVRAEKAAAPKEAPSSGGAASGGGGGGGGGGGEGSVPMVAKATAAPGRTVHLGRTHAAPGGGGDVPDEEGEAPDWGAEESWR